MYFNRYEWNRIYFSWTRIYMTSIGASAMAIVMFLYMRNMYTNKGKNMAIVLGSLAIMGFSTYLVRQQEPIEDGKWMKAMIPHRSSQVKEPH